MKALIKVIDSSENEDELDYEALGLEQPESDHYWTDYYFDSSTVECFFVPRSKEVIIVGFKGAGDQYLKYEEELEERLIKLLIDK